MIKILVINGPNINMIGIREPEIYGKKTYYDLVEFCKEVGLEKGVEVECFQSNHEGEIVDTIQEAYGRFDGIVINPAAYTHTSIAILDALKAVSIPTVEVHLTDVDNREDFRKVSYVREACIRTVTGMGFEGYRLAMAVLVNHITPVPNPRQIEPDGRYDSFANNEVLLNKKTGRLPIMGWNSWNAFGTNNNEETTKAVADAIVDLELDKCGYRYVVLDDGCYKPERVDGCLTNEIARFPSGFKTLADYIHGKGLSFGMYNDIGTNLCSGAAVGTFGHEKEDAEKYAEWDVDFLKVDNCYYMWDDAAFSDRDRVRYVFAPNVKGIRIEGMGTDISLNAVTDGIITGEGTHIENDYVTHIGTFDGAGPERTPARTESGELVFEVDAPADGDYKLYVNCATGCEVGAGQWLQVAVGEQGKGAVVYDDLVEDTGSKDIFAETKAIGLKLCKGRNVIRIMNHRRQENTLSSYKTMKEELMKACNGRDVAFSLCEWGKNQPQNWAYKIGDSWRILNDITFTVGDIGYPGQAAWKDDYTLSITSQYNKAVIMDEFSGLDKGWNDPDMLVIGMNGVDNTMCKTHMAMWCMMNSPLMLGLDLRRVTKGDDIWQIIANKELIALNQDELGIQAKRVDSIIENNEEGGCTYNHVENPDKEYVREGRRVDILAKPLADNSIAVAFFNISDNDWLRREEITVDRIIEAIGDKLPACGKWNEAARITVRNLWTGEETTSAISPLAVEGLKACDSAVYRVYIG